jgi:SAM-dependent methyltransferase
MFEWPNGVAMPPAYNMARHGHEHLIMQSKGICGQLYNIIQQLPIPSVPLALDFGAGVGRVAIPMLYSLGYPQLAVDIDPKCVDYLNTSTNEKIEAKCINQGDKLPYPRDHLDLVIAISVFTHLDKYLEGFYLAESARIVRPGGYCLFSVSSEKALASRKKKGMIEWKDVLITDLHCQGHIYKPKPSAVDARHGYSLHSEDYIKTHWSNYFEVAHIYKNYIDNVQDLVVLKKLAQ